MKSEDQQFHKCYLLHRRHFRESSLLLELFSEEYGRVGVIARGARGSKGNQSGVLQPFQQLLVSWGGQGELKKLYKVEQLEGGKPLLGDALIAGLYLNELMVYLMHRFDPHPELFEYYHQTIYQISQTQDNLEWNLRLFEKNMLESIGYGLRLVYEVETGEMVQDEKQYCYQLETGPLASLSDCTGVQLSGKTLLTLESEAEPDSGILKESKKLMRMVISHQLGGKELNSRRLFNRKK